MISARSSTISQRPSRGPSLTHNGSRAWRLCARKAVSSVMPNRQAPPPSSTRSVSIQAATCNDALWQKWLSRISGSPKNIALGHLILAILISFCSGILLMTGLHAVFRGQTSYWIYLISSPALLGIAIAYGRLVWQAIP